MKAYLLRLRDRLPGGKAIEVKSIHERGSKSDFLLPLSKVEVVAEWFQPVGGNGVLTRVAIIRIPDNLTRSNGLIEEDEHKEGSVHEFPGKG